MATHSSILAWRIPWTEKPGGLQSLVFQSVRYTWRINTLTVDSALCWAVLCHSVVSDSLRPHRLYPTRLLCPWGFSRQEYWSGFSYPPPGDLPNPGTEPRSEPSGKPGILEWVGYPFSRGTS